MIDRKSCRRREYEHDLQIAKEGGAGGSGRRHGRFGEEMTP